MVRNRCRLCRFGGLNRGQTAPADPNVGFYSVRDAHWSQRLSSIWDCLLQGSPLATSLDPPDTVTPTASVVTIRTLHVPSNVLHTLTAHLFWIPDKTKQPSVCSLLWVSALLKCSFLLFWLPSPPKPCAHSICRTIDQAWQHFLRAMMLQYIETSLHCYCRCP